MNKKYIDEALARADRASELADKVRNTQSALDALPKEGRELEQLLADDAFNLHIAMITDGEATVVKAPVPDGEQCRVYNLLKKSLQEIHDKALAELVREQAPTTGTH